MLFLTMRIEPSFPSSIILTFVPSPIFSFLRISSGMTTLPLASTVVSDKIIPLSFPPELDKRFFVDAQSFPNRRESEQPTPRDGWKRTQEPKPSSKGGRRVLAKAGV